LGASPGEQLAQLLEECGAHGSTLIHVEGSGSRGKRFADLPEAANIKLNVLVQPAAAERILERRGGRVFHALRDHRLRDRRARGAGGEIPGCGVRRLR